VNVLDDLSHSHHVYVQEGENGVCGSISALLYPFAKIGIYDGREHWRSSCGLQPFPEEEKFGVQTRSHSTSTVILREIYKRFMFSCNYTQEFVAHFLLARTCLNWKSSELEKVQLFCFILSIYFYCKPIHRK
jgi:hypothetical protein